MPWYYAGPDAKPVGPLSLEELQARRLNGTLSPETHVIEHTGQPNAVLAWKRYRDVFPSSPVLPPLPPVFSAPPAPPPPPHAAPPQPVAPHPLFPSAIATRSPVFPPDTRPDPHHQVKSTNGWCKWGFVLGLAAFLFSFVCVGLLLAVPSLLLCVMGLVQVQQKRDQSGHGLAIAGLLLSGAALLISVVILSVAIPYIRAHELTVTEQTSNDSE